MLYLKAIFTATLLAATATTAWACATARSSTSMARIPKRTAEVHPSKRMPLHCVPTPSRHTLVALHVPLSSLVYGGRHTFILPTFNVVSMFYGPNAPGVEDFMIRNKRVAVPYWTRQESSAVQHLKIQLWNELHLPLVYLGKVRVHGPTAVYLCVHW
ncbi:hypothetical protein C8R45DRAFT_937255 [Mycena sanguinolenta]|nr:hypothetical protein C8R45DRAFT_937255 [Mycena sanguinolenta]